MLLIPSKPWPVPASNGYCKLLNNFVPTPLNHTPSLQFVHAMDSKGSFQIVAKFLVTDWEEIVDSGIGF